MTNQQTFNDVTDCCAWCGASLRRRNESLNQGLGKALVTFYLKTIELNRTELHLRDDCIFDTDIDSNNNFQKLQYFGLCEQAGKAGFWRLTDKALRFLQNGERVSKRVQVFRNKVEKVSDEQVSLTEVLRSEPYWLKREDFV